MDMEREKRIADAWKNFGFHLTITVALWFLAPRWLHLRDLVLPLILLSQGAQLVVHYLTHEWVFAHEEPGRDYFANYSPKSWIPAQRTDDSGRTDPAERLFRAAGRTTAAAEGALFILVLLRLVPGIMDAMEKTFVHPPV